MPPTPLFEKRLRRCRISVPPFRSHRQQRIYSHSLHYTPPRPLLPALGPACRAPARPPGLEYIRIAVARWRGRRGLAGAHLTNCGLAPAARPTPWPCFFGLPPWPAGLVPGTRQARPLVPVTAALPPYARPPPGTGKHGKTGRGHARLPADHNAPPARPLTTQVS